jgi:hypothetical protein
MKLYTKDNEGTSLIKPGMWIESYSLHKLNLLIKLQRMFFEWKGINRKQSTRWQHLSWLKASAFVSLQFF